MVEELGTVETLREDFIAGVSHELKTPLTAIEGYAVLLGEPDITAAEQRQYTQKILAFYGLNEDELAKAGSLTYGTNVKEVTTQVAEGSVDAGVIYCTDAFSAGLTVVDAATKDMCGQVIYPAAVLKTAEHAEAAQAFLDYLQTEEAMKVFESVGFSPVSVKE